MGLFHYHGVKFPQIIRAEDLEHFSEGWPPLGESRARRWKGICVRISIYLTLMTLLVAFIGFRDVLAGFPASVTFPKWLLAKAWGQLLAGGIFFLLLEGWVAYSVFWGKRLPWVLVVFAWIGVYGMLWSASGEYHSISHAMFESCMGYSDFVFKMAAGIACLITVIWLLEFRLRRGVGHAGLRLVSGFRMTRTRWRVCGLLAIAACWVGTLLFFDVL